MLIAGPAGADDEDAVKQVLVLYSFGTDYFADIAQGLKTELGGAPVPVELFEVSLETARFADTRSEEPFLHYLHALFDETSLDLVIAVAAPAARFTMQHREELFPSVPLVLAGVESRVMKGIPQEGAISVPFVLDFGAVIENIRSVEPDTSEIVMVLGRSAISRLWLSVLKRELEPYSRRARFTWFHDMPLDEMVDEVAALPPHAAVLFLEYGVEAGLANAEDRALESLSRASSVPVFGLFESQLGKGIVGGLLLSETEIGRRAGTIARALFEGASPDSTNPIVAGRPEYDFRELERWDIRESRLPSGSTVLFRQPSVWDAYRGPLLVGLAVMVVQAALIAALLLQYFRRRAAQEESRALARRLLTAQEDERRRLARELHDDLSQRLATLGLDAARMERAMTDSPGKDSARAMRADLARLGEDVHDLSYQLHPSVLEELGLKQALEVECERFSVRESIPAWVESFQTPTGLTKEAAVCLFRIAQEALRNVARHAGAKSVSIRVLEENGSISMTVRDDGVGFDPAQPHTRLSLGHASMRERAGLVRGIVRFDSAPGRGTTVKVSVPLAEKPL